MELRRQRGPRKMAAKYFEYRLGKHSTVCIELSIFPQNTNFYSRGASYARVLAVVVSVCHTLVLCQNG